MGSESCIFHPILISLSRRVLAFLKKQKFFNCKNRKYLKGTVNHNKLRIQKLWVLMESISCPQSHRCGSLNSCVVLNTLQFGRQPYIIASAAMGSFILQSWKGTKRMVGDARKIWSLEAVHWCPDIIIPLFVQSFK